jgi:O-antigen/teichoic acid export membrane protein
LIPLLILLAGTAELYRTNPKRLRALEVMAGQSAQAIGAATAGGFLIFAPAFLGLWLGPGYGQAALSLRFLAIAALVNVWSAPWFYYAVGRGRHHYVLIAGSANIVVNASFTLLLTTRIGLLGALLGSLAGNAAGTFAGWLMLRRWDRRSWLLPTFRINAVVAVAVLPMLFLSESLFKGWINLIGWATVYLLGCLVLLLLTRSLPMRVTWDGRRKVGILWRGEKGSDVDLLNKTESAIDDPLRLIEQ